MSRRRQVSSELSAKVVRHLLQMKGLTQEQLAELLDVSPAFVSRLLSQERSLTIDHLQLIEERLDTPVGALFLAVQQPANDDPKVAKLRAMAVKLLNQADRATAAIRASQAKTSPAVRRKASA